MLQIVEIIHQIGEVFGSLILGILALLFVYYSVIKPLCMFLEWCKDHIHRRNKHSVKSKELNQSTVDDHYINIANEQTPASIDLNLKENADDSINVEPEKPLDTEQKEDPLPYIFIPPPHKKIVLSKQSPELNTEDKPVSSSARSDSFVHSPVKQSLPKSKNITRYQVTDKNVKFFIDRGVKWLYHFTNTENIEGIIQKGILSRHFQEKQHIVAKCNDPNEAGSQYISVSIEWPNYKMFYKKRIDNPHERFAVVCISVFCLTECDFLMYSTNSSKDYGTAIVENASELYYNSSSRKYLSSAKFPTDPQAELRILNCIPTKYIKAIYFESYDDLFAYLNTHEKNDKYRVANVLFSGREDYEAWR